MDSSDDVSRRWAEGVRAAATRAYAASQGSDPPERRPTRWRLDTRTAVTAAVAVVVVGVWAWWGLRPDAMVPVAVTPSPAASAAAAAAPVVVHVSGQVGEPGLVELPAGARVADAIAAAGELGPDADESSVNLARRLVDGEHVVVGARGETSGSLLVDLNSADAAGLEVLPGVGPVLASRIVADREANGPFLAVEDLGRVSGVGPALLAGIAELATT